MRPTRTPIVREIPLADPLAALRALADLPGAFLLHSGQAEPRGRWSFFGADPIATFGPGRYEQAIGLWREARDRFAGLGDPALPPFMGGLVGAWSYDFGRRLERLPAIARDDRGWPDVWLAAHDVVGALDHASGRAVLIASGWSDGDVARTARRLDALRRRLEAADAPARVEAPAEGAARTPPAAIRSTFDPRDYRAGVERIRDHIRRGDLYQANLSQRWTARFDGDPGEGARRLFESLARRSPAPFAAFLDLGGHAVASASPERFLEVRGDRVETRPIKGTRPRGADAEADARERAALLASPKDRAENVMIVDVLRNDLGRVCEVGSVETPELCALESFAQVHHLTSTVTGRLRSGRDALDLLHASFPGGSITGAPKIRAMEILEGLEPVRRGLYTGAIGYLDVRGDADWSIAIRTAIVSPGRIDFAAGGGITADSDPEAERLETLAKAEGWRVAMAEGGWPVRFAEADGFAPAVAEPAGASGEGTREPLAAARGSGS